MKTKFTLIVAILISQNILSQTPDWLWAKGIGGTSTEQSYAIAADPFGNVYTTGSFFGTLDFDPGPGVHALIAGNSDIFVCKLDASGNFAWAKSMGIANGADEGYAIAVDASSNVYVTGAFQGSVDFDPGPGLHFLTSAGDFDVFVLKLDSAGNFLWARSMGGPDDNEGYSIVVSPSAGSFVYITGQFFSTGDFDPGPGISNLNSAGDYDIFICKLDSAGNFLWAKSMGGPGQDYGSSAVDSIGNVYTTGRFYGMADFDPDTSSFYLTTAGDADIFISKLDTAGNFAWAKSIGSAAYDEGFAIAVDWSGSGAIYLTGNFTDTVDFDPGPGTFFLNTPNSFSNIYVSKFDEFGNFKWAKTVQGTGAANGYEIACDLSGSSNVFISGSFSGTVDFDEGPGTMSLSTTPINMPDIFFLKLNASGNLVWVKSIGSIDLEDCYSITIDALGNLNATGIFTSSQVLFGSTTLTNAGGLDMFISKLDTSIFTGIIELNTIGNRILIFPNPAINEIRVQHSEFHVQRFEILNLFGERVCSKQISSSNSEQIAIDISTLNAGIYFLKIMGENIENVSKFVKE